MCCFVKSYCHSSSVNLFDKCTTLGFWHHLTAEENKAYMVRYESSIPFVGYISAQHLFKNWQHILAPCCFKTTTKSVRCILKAISMLRNSFNFFSTRSNIIPKTKEIQLYALRELAKHLHEGKNSLERCYLYMIEVDAMASLESLGIFCNAQPKRPITRKRMQL